MKRSKKHDAEYMDPRWQQLRLAAFERDDWTCRLCQIPNKAITAHHAWYQRPRRCWEYPLDSIFTLCLDCNNLCPYFVIRDTRTAEPDSAAIWEIERASVMSRVIHRKSANRSLTFAPGRAASTSVDP